MFINFKDNAFLDKQGFTPIGEIDEADMKIIEQINSEDKEQPKQNKINNRGNEYLNSEFPNLSYIDSARVV